MSTIQPIRTVLKGDDKTCMHFLVRKRRFRFFLHLATLYFGFCDEILFYHDVFTGSGAYAILLLLLFTCLVSCRNKKIGRYFTFIAELYTFYCYISKTIFDCCQTFARQCSVWSHKTTNESNRFCQLRRRHGRLSTGKLSGHEIIK